MRFPKTTLLFLSVLTAVASAQGREDRHEPAKTKAQPKTVPPATDLEETQESRLSMTDAVACRAIEGFENFEILPNASLTADEKLLVYYRPFNYHVEKQTNSYRVHLTQDGQIRRHGEKAVLQRKEKLLEYEFKVDYEPAQLYLKNTISLKGLKPGQYEFDIILHDKLAKTAAATQSLSFRIVPAAIPAEESDASSGSEAPPPTEPSHKRAKPPKNLSPKSQRSGSQN